jgi:hypothetical protein
MVSKESFDSTCIPSLFVVHYLQLGALFTLTSPSVVTRLSKAPIMASNKGWRRTLLSLSSFFLFITLGIYLRRESLETPGDRLHTRSIVNVHDTRLPILSNTSSLHRRDYTCDASTPCSNGAYCGETGNCGYGPTYCGAGCTSNCDATAECGEYAATSGTTCPLNTCCSQYGFCGTTEDYCSENCQSNCDLSPSPPSGSAVDQALSKGMYRALWIIVSLLISDIL